MNSYYNTNLLTGEDLKKAVASARFQETAILLIYENSGKPYSPSVIFKLLQKAGKNWPLTSCRRAITNLEKSGHLLKTDNMVIGNYGKPEHQWIKK